MKRSSPYLLSRLLALAPLLLGITLISFAVIHLAPGTPVDARGELNLKMTSQAREKLTQLYGLDRPVLEQYAHWFKRVVVFDYGNSFVDGEKVSAKIARAIPVTLGVNLLALLLILGIGIPLGVWGAVHKDRPLEKALTVFLFAGFSIPTFWLSLIMMSLFGVQWHFLPVSGLTSLFYDQMSPIHKVIDIARHLALPLAVSSLTGLAGISRFMRSSMLSALRENYVLAARAKGLDENKVLYGHALKNALLPIVTIVGLAVPGLLGGSVVLESIFSIPGMGRLFFNSVFARDYPVIMGILVLGAVLTLLGNLLADLAYRLADPRIRLQ